MPPLSSLPHPSLQIAPGLSNHTIHACKQSLSCARTAAQTSSSTKSQSGLLAKDHPPTPKCFQINSKLPLAALLRPCMLCCWPALTLDSSQQAPPVISLAHARLFAIVLPLHREQSKRDCHFTSFSKMSVAVCRGPVLPTFEAPTSWPLRRVEPPYKQPPVEVAVELEHPPAQAEVWDTIIQADMNKNKQPVEVAAKKQAPSKPYVHPLVRRSSSLMSQKSLEVCTESLGNETGSGDFTSSLDDMARLFDSPAPAVAAEEPLWWQHDDAARDVVEDQWEAGKDKGLAAVNYHRSSCRGTTAPPRRAFPPPLPSMSRRDGPCLQMRPRRQDGRLVVEAVAVRPRGYLNASRQGGRLRLSFVECFARDQTASASNAITDGAAEASYFPIVEPTRTNVQEEELAVEMEEDDVADGDEEEAVEVVDRGTVVEVKVSTQPQTAAAGKVHRSTLVINKFVGGTPLSVSVDQQPRCCHADEESSDDETVAAHSPRSTLRRVPSSTTSLAAAVAVASTGTEAPEDDDDCGWVHRSVAAVATAAAETRKQQPLLFTSRRGDKQDLLQTVRTCRQLKEKRLFILEPYCIATS